MEIYRLVVLVHKKSKTIYKIIQFKKKLCTKKIYKSFCSLDDFLNCQHSDRFAMEFSKCSEPQTLK